jgi:hypothetical protein
LRMCIQGDAPACGLVCTRLRHASRRPPDHVRRCFEVGHHVHSAAHGPPRTYKQGSTMTALSDSNTTGSRHSR